jgi:hypothetical protein
MFTSIVSISTLVGVFFDSLVLFFRDRVDFLLVLPRCRECLEAWRRVVVRLALVERERDEDERYLLLPRRRESRLGEREITERLELRRVSERFRCFFLAILK